MSDLKPFCDGPFKTNDLTCWIVGVDTFGGDCHMLDVRGWGYLTGHGQALGLDAKTARTKQIETARWVVDALNAAWSGDTITRAEADAMVAAERERCAKLANDQAQVFRDEAHDQMQLGHREMHKRAKMIASFFDAHATAIRAGKEKP